jgi:hypothetical protein
MGKRLPQLAYEWNLPLFLLLQYALEAKCGHEPTNAQIQELERRIGDYNSLDEFQIRRLEDFLHAPEAGRYVTQASVVLPSLNEDQTNAYLDELSTKLFELMEDEELKRRITPRTIRQTVINLGVIEVQRSSSGTPDLKEVLAGEPVSPKYLRHAIRGYFCKILETSRATSADDLYALREEIDKTSAQLRQMRGGSK